MVYNVKISPGICHNASVQKGQIYFNILFMCSSMTHYNGIYTLYSYRSVDAYTFISEQFS